MKTAKCILKWFFIGLVILFIYLPIVFLSFNSFNASDNIQIWKGFSLDHYKFFFNFDNAPLQIVINTLILSAVVATLSTVFGTIGAIGIFYCKKRTSSILTGINQIPVINADVVTAISLALLIAILGIDRNTFIPLVLGQMVLCTPFVILSVIPKLEQMDPNLYEAALDLGASPRKALFSVVIPQILPGIISGFLLAVTLSLDDFVIADYTKPDTFQTISTHIYNLRANTAGTKTKASYWAFTAIIFLIIVIVLVIANIISYKKSRSKKQ